MWSIGLARVVASICGFMSALCAAVGVTIFFAWALDSSGPVTLMPLLAGLGVLVIAGALFLARRLLRIRYGRPDSTRMAAPDA